MKGNKSRVAVPKTSIPEYERQRLEKIKLNAERMQAKGLGFFANKILKRSQGFYLNDDEATSAYDGNNEDDDETTENMEVQNVICKKKRVTKQISNSMMRSSVPKRSMAEFTKTSNPKQHLQVEQVDDSNKTSYVQKVQKKQSHNLLTCEKDRPAILSQKNKQKRVFCSPGSMSAYRDYIKKNSQHKEVVSESNFISNTSGSAPIKDVDDDLALEENNNDVDDVLATQEENENDIGYVSERDFEMEMDALVEHENEGENEGCKKKKHRGPTTLLKVHTRTIEERQAIILNSLGQPVGPTPEVVVEFKFFLGTVAKDPKLAPLNYCNFPSLPTLDKIWDYVLEKYMVPIAGKKWVMDAINRSWRCYKCRFKKKHYYAYDNDELRWKFKPETISDMQFRDLLKYWECEKIEEESKVNKENRSMLKDMHTLGRKSFASLRYELQQKDPNKKEPSQAMIYKESRKRTPGRTYLTNNEKTQEYIEKMDILESAQQGESDNYKDPYTQVISEPKRKSRVRLVGSCVTKNDLKKKEGSKSGFILPEEMKADLVQEFAPTFATMKAEMVQQLVPSLTTAILSQLQEANPGMKIVIPPIHENVSSVPYHEPNGLLSNFGATVNQVQDEQSGEEI